MSKKATIYDVAKSCGLSAPTVSRVLSNSDYPVSKEARDKILKTAKELNYSPNILGKQLRTKTSREIGVIVPDISNYDFVMLFEEIQKQALTLGYNAILCNSLSDIEIEKSNVDLLIQKQVAGVIMNSLDATGETSKRILQRGIHVVLIDQYLGVECSKISVNYKKLANQAIEFLSKNGHRRIGLMTPPVDRTSRKIMCRSFLDEIERLNVPEAERYIFESCHQVQLLESEQSIRFPDGDLLIKRMIDMGNECPTALLCMNDLTAIAIMHELQIHGIRIPEQMSIIGIDNSPFSRIIFPPLTSIDICTPDMAYMATDLLIAQIQSNEQQNEISYVTPHIVERGSVKFLN